MTPRPAAVPSAGARRARRTVLAAALLLLGSAPALAQTTEPSVPAGCGGTGSADQPVFSSVTSTASTVTLTYGDLTGQTGILAIQACGPAPTPSDPNAYARDDPGIEYSSPAQHPSAGDTETITGLTRDTDYWFRMSSYAGTSPWSYIRTKVALVSNTGQFTSPNNRSVNTTFSQAQAFTAGDHAEGYTLIDVGLRINNWSDSSAFTASIYSTTGGAPDASLYTLTNPASPTDAAVNVFAAPANATLDASTTYALVLEGSAGSVAGVDAARADDEDAGAATGWSIANGRHWMRNTDTSWTADSASLFIWVGATENAAAATGPAITIAGGADVAEGTAATFTVTASPAPTANLTVNVTVSESAGSDYVAAANEGSKTVTINANDTSATFSIATEDDFAEEPTGTVTVTVETGTGYTVGTTSSADVTVTNDDDALVANIGKAKNGSAGALSFSWAQAFTTGSNAADYTLDSIELNFDSAPSSGLDVKVRQGTFNGTLLASLTNPSSLTTGNLEFDAPNGTTLEADTTYLVVVTYPGGSSMPGSMTSTTDDAESAALGWSLADDSVRWTGSTSTNDPSALSIRVNGSTNTAAATGPAITIAPGTTPVTEGTAATFTVTADTAPAANLTVNLNVSESGDFVAAGDEGAKTVVIAASATTATYSVPTQGDSTDEPDGTVTVTVGTGAGYTVGATNSASVTVQDDDAAPVQTAPSAPAAPTVANAGSAALRASWSAPSDLGSATAIADYDLRYFAGTADPANAADWIEEGESNGPPNPGAATSARIAGLTEGQAYRVQVRAMGDLESPWSTSGSATPANRAPRLLEEKPGNQGVGENGCQAKSNLSTPADEINAPTRTLVSLQLDGRAAGDTGEFPAQCFDGNDTTTAFDDPDGDALTFTFDAGNRPDNVWIESDLPTISANRLYVRGAAAFRQTDLDIAVTATDPAGLTVTGTYRYVMGSFADTGAPTFGAAVAAQSYTAGQQIDELQLPAASGGDLFVDDHDGDPGTPAEAIFSYVYEVTGLPDGLSFDADTRKVTGTPTTAGGPTTVTYTAADADLDTSDADKASLTFDVTVEAGSRDITGVAITSTPTRDADADGTPDTYLRGDTIEVTVTWASDVTWDVSADPAATISASLGIGSDTRDATLATGGTTTGTARSLRFRYAVVQADSDGDGLAVTSTTTQVGTFLLSQHQGATLVDAAGRAASREHAGLAADANHKVDGSVLGDAPSEPGAPAVAAASTTSLWVRWSAPGDLGSATAITDYDLRYFQGAADPADEADWIEEGEATGPPDPGAATAAVIAGLTQGAAYRVQVRALGDGESPWSASGAGAPATPAAPLVSNTGQPDDRTVALSHEHRQRFTTGGNSLGYRLTHVELEMQDAAATTPTFSVHVWSVTGGVVDSDLGALTQVGGLPGTFGTVRFAADGDGIDLDASATYQLEILVSANASGDTGIRATTSTAEDPGASAGWSIRDLTRSRPVGGEWTPAAGALQIAVHGEAKTTLVGNIGRTTTEGFGLDFDRAQGFTTGTEAATLDGVRVRFTTDPGANVSVRLATGLPAATEVVATLENPATTGAGELVFAAPGFTVLEAGTAYFVVVATDAGAAASVAVTEDDDEDAGGVAGWVVWNQHHHRPAGSADPWTEDGNAPTRAMLIRVDGDLGTAPSKPAAPTVAAASATSLDVSWSAPADLGSAAAIADYDLRYFAGTADPADAADWIEEGEAGGLPDPGTATTATITGLTANTAYRVQVRAMGDFESPWSDSGSGAAMAGAGPAVTVSGGDPVVEGADAVFTVAANPAPLADLTVNLEISDSGGGSDYVAAGDEGAKTVLIPAGSAEAVHRVPTQADTTDEPHGTVTATVGTGVNYTVGATDSAGVTVNDDDASAGGPAVLVGNTGRGATNDVSFNFDYAQAFTTGGATGGYRVTRVEILARDVAGDGSYGFTAGVWSHGGSAPGAAKVADLGTPSLPQQWGRVQLNVTGGGVVLQPGTTYWLVLDVSSGGDHDLFGTTGQHSEDGGKSPGWSIGNGLVNRNRGSTGGWTKQNFNLRLDIVGEENPAAAPSAPRAPSVAVASPTSLAVGWPPPSDLGSAAAIADYDLRYYAGAADPANEADWIEEGEAGAPPDPGADTSAMLTGLTEGQPYRVQVRAFGHLESPWSASGGGTPRSPPRTEKLVSNTAQPETRTNADFSHDRAQSFTTGDRGGRLTRVDLRLRSSAATPPAFSVSIQGDSGSLPDGTDLGTLSTATSLSGSYATFEFAASGGGIDLAAGTTYWVVLDVNAADSDTEVQLLLATGDDADGAANWSIGNGHHFRNADDSGAWATGAGIYPLVLAVHGRLKPPTLVGNLGRATTEGFGLDFDRAQGFTTGSEAATLDGVEVRFSADPGANVLVQVAEGLPAATNVVATLENPATTGAGDLAFAAPPSTMLEAATTYHVVVRTDAGAAAGVAVTEDDAEDGGGESGWSVADLHHHRAAGSMDAWTADGNSPTRAMLVRVNGTIPSANPAVTIAPGTSPVTEGTAATFTVTATPAPRAGTTVNLTVSESGPGDFVAATDEGSKTVTIPASTASATYSVPTQGDGAVEADGTVTVAVASGAGYTVGATSSAEVAVEDDDTPTAANPAITIAGGSAVTEGAAATFTVTANPAPSANVTVSLTVSESSVSDYVAAAAEGGKTVTINSGDTTATYEVPTQDDGDDEPNGTVTVQVGTGTGYTVGTMGSAGVTVRDDDAPAGGGPTPGALVSNTGQSDDATTGFDHDNLGGFTTGGHAGGYKLTRVDLEMQGTAATTPTFSMAVWGENLLVRLGTLTQQDSLLATFGTVRFAASGDGIDLEPNTFYAWETDVTANPSADVTARVTASDDEDPNPAAGWSIGNNRGFKAWDNPAWSFDTNNAIKFAVHGHERPLKLVSNTAQTDGGDASLANDHAQAFTTGGAAGGYRLLGVDLELELTSGTAPTYTVKIHEEDTSSGPGGPDESTAVGTLAQRGDLPEGANSAALVRFTASGDGLELERETTYYAVFDVTGTPSSTATLGRINANAEDDGAAAGWSIADGRLWRASGDTTWTLQQSTNHVLKLAVHGLERPATPGSTDPVVTIDPDSPIVTEGLGAPFTVTANPAPAANLTVNLTVSEAAGSDYVAAGDEGPKTVTINAGDTTATYSVPTQGDTADEPDGLVTVTVETGTGYTVGTMASADVPVADDDEPPGPELLDAVVFEATLTLVYAAELDSTSTPADTDFAVTVDGAARSLASPPVVTDSRVVLTLDAAVTAGQAVRLTYTAGANPIRDANGDAANLANRSVTNLAGDTTGPTLRSATVDTRAGPTSTVVLVYSELLDPDFEPLPGQYTVRVGAASPAVTAVAVAGRRVTLTLAAAVTEGQAVEFDYNCCSAGTNVPVKDYAGNVAGNLTVQAVTHGPPPEDKPPSGGGSGPGGGGSGPGGGGNEAPTAAAIADRALHLGAALTVDLSDVFDDPDDDALEYAAESSDEAVATAAVEGATLTVRAVAAGSAVITVTATDPDDASATARFTVTVTETVVSIAAVAASVPEGGAAAFALTAAPAPGADLAVTVAVSGGAAYGVADGARTVAIAAGATDATLRLATMDDEVEEPDATLAVELRAGDGYAVDAEAGRATVELLDDDGPPNTAPTVAQEIPDVEVEPDAPVALDLAEYFADAEDETLSYAAEPADSPLLDIAVADGVLTLTAREDADGGAVEVTVTATDSRGLSVAQTFTATVAPMTRTTWSAWLLDALLEAVAAEQQETEPEAAAAASGDADD